MGTREDAGGPGALGRVRAAWRVALGGLWLAVRALAARAGPTLALTALTAFAVGVAAVLKEGTFPRSRRQLETLAEIAETNGGRIRQLW